MKIAAATLFFGLLTAHSAMAAECYSYSDYESVNNTPAACLGMPAAQQGESLLILSDTGFKSGAVLAFLQSSYKSGNEYAAAV